MRKSSQFSGFLETVGPIRDGLAGLMREERWLCTGVSVRPIFRRIVANDDAIPERKGKLASVRAGLLGGSID
jgi:hypothetical protein